MNQILDTNTFDKNLLLPAANTSSKKFKWIFRGSLLVIFLCLIFYLFSTYHAWKKEELSRNLVNQFSIRNLYASTNEYTAEKLTANLENSNPFVIGLLKIDKINLMYPILSTTSDELLSISPCRFYGPMPNEIGNLCIAGHNYANQTHFAKLSSLQEGDSLQIYDLNGGYLDYTIYQKSEVAANDTSCISQEVGENREVTLITCNTIKGTRIVIKAKENR